jgi:hypothetical protein
LERNGQAVTSLIIGKENGSYSLQRVGGDSRKFLSSWEKFNTYVASKTVPTLVLYLKLNNVNPSQVSSASEITKALKDDLEMNLINQGQTEPQFGSGGGFSAHASTTGRSHTPIAIAFGIACLLGVGSFRLIRKKS